MTRTYEVVVIGGGQAGLATAHHLQRRGLAPHEQFVVLDANPLPGGAWQHRWPGLQLLSPAEYSSLPGTPMPAWRGPGTPDAAHVTAYLADYERRHQVPVRRPVRVTRLQRGPDHLQVHTDDGVLQAHHVVNATGTWTRPWVPSWAGAATFTGRHLHTSGYRGPQEFVDQRVLVVGGGNAAAQILAEVSTVAATRWVTRRRPRFMSDEIDGRAVFQVAAAQRADTDPDQARGNVDLGDIVMTPPVLAAREMGVLVAHRPFERFDQAAALWDQGSRWDTDAVIWATGFRPELRHLRGAGLFTDQARIDVNGTTARADPRVHLVGYGTWTGIASATLTGVGRSVADLAAGLT